MERDPNVLVLKDLLIPGGRVGDITILNGKVIHLGAGLRADQTIQCRGKIVIPAAVDMHVHMRSGLQSAKEDWKTGSMSALAGGVTVVVDQPNTIPPIITGERFRDRVDDARRSSLCNFAINAGVTPDAELLKMWNCGAMAYGETFAGPSSYGEAISPDQLSLALKTIHDLGGIATIHAEIVHDGEDISLHYHDEIRSGSGEAEAILMVQRVNTSRCRLHFCHLSTADSIKTLSDETCEVTPHHLYLSYERFDPEDGFGKVNPALRTERVRKDLWSCWDRIDVIASDHAPHTRYEKEGSFITVPSGMPGVETMLPLLMADVSRGRISLPDLIQKTVTNPCRILGIPPAGFSPGDRADFALYGVKPEKIECDLLHSKAGWTPYEGFEAIFPDTVIMGGEQVYDAGTFYPGKPEWIRGRGYKERSAII